MLDKIITKLKNKYISITFSMIILIFILIIYPKIWGYVFAILLSFLIADLIRFSIIKGGKGIVQFPFLGTNKTQTKGHGYLIFFLFVVFGTVISGYTSNLITNYITNYILGYWSYIIPNILISILVYLDFELLFYKK